MNKLHETLTYPGGPLWATWLCEDCGHTESTITREPVREHECPECAQQEAVKC